MKNLISRLSLGAILFSLLVPQALGSSSLEIDTIDTVAGYGALVRISNAPSNAPIEVLLEKPDGSQVLLEAQTDNQGKTKMDIEGFYTKKSGNYLIKARVKTENDFTSETFKVYPDTVSASRSLVELNKTTVTANGNDYAELTVYLNDRYGNPIAGHNVSLISSRLNDEIVRISSNPYTSSQGQMIFHLYSQEEGVAIFAIQDTTSNITLNERAKIAFYAPQTTMSEMGGFSNGFTSVLLASDQSPGGEVSYLTIENLDENTTVGRTLNFTVTAYDSTGNIATDYPGEVRFSSSDDNATLPDDYQFEAEDQGTHTFSLGLSFKTTGTQTLTVTDLSNTGIKGSFNVTVSASGTGMNNNTDGTPISTPNGLTLFTPNSGTYSSNSLTFSGEAPYGMTVKILDQGQIVASANINASGTFSTLASNLKDGDHVFTVSTVDATGATQETSNELTITIDTTAPSIDQIKIDPETDLPAGDTFTVTLYTEKELQKASVLFNNGLYTLTENLLISGVYTGTVNAPEDIGEYELDAILVDNVGNEASLNNVLTLNVIENPDAASMGETDPTNLDETLPEEEIPLAPATVTGVEAVAGDGRVTLSWDIPETIDLEDLSLTMEGTTEEVTSITTDETITPENLPLMLTDTTEEALIETFTDEQTIDESLTDETITTDEEPSVEIDHYRIYYGPDPDLLYSTDDTWDNSNSWYVDELNNGTTYYFAVVAVAKDESGTESVEKSTVVNATPKAQEVVALYAAAIEESEEANQEEALQTAVEEEETPDTGPEIIWLMVFSLGVGMIYIQRRKNWATQINS
ncbi:MAG: Ig-like domain-containing protein [Candidatus Gracilibacteria bacterium]